MSTTHQTFEDDGQDDITTGNLYNGNGQRIRLTWNGSLYQKYYYMGSALFFTTDANNLRDSENILSPGGSIVASRRQDSSDANKYYFYHTDIRGSVTNIVGTKENAIYLAQGYNYDNFGKEEALKSESSFKNDVTFTGAVSDSMTGLYYMNARHYDPDTGRFLQQDTYKGSAAVPWTQHLYAYTGNNPVNMVDPTGHYTNTASDQYANYTYDWSSKTLVPIVNYSNTMTDQYQGDYGKIHSTISKNGIQRRRANMPKSSTNTRSDVVSELRKEAISGQNYERLANDYSAIRTYASDGIGYMSADEAAQAWADRFAKQSYYNEKSSIIYSITDPRNNETRYYYGVTYEGNQYDTIPGTIIGYIDERAKSFIYPMRKTVAHIHSHPYPGDGDWHNDVPSVTDEILPGLPGIEEAYLVPNKALCDDMPKIIKISDRDSWYPHRFKGWGY